MFCFVFEVLNGVAAVYDHIKQIRCFRIVTLRAVGSRGLFTWSISWPFGVWKMTGRGGGRGMAKDWVWRARSILYRGDSFKSENDVTWRRKPAVIKSIDKDEALDCVAKHIGVVLRLHEQVSTAFGVKLRQLVIVAPVHPKRGLLGVPWRIVHAVLVSTLIRVLPLIVTVRTHRLPIWIAAYKLATSIYTTLSKRIPDKCSVVLVKSIRFVVQIIEVTWVSFRGLPRAIVVYLLFGWRNYFTLVEAAYLSNWFLIVPVFVVFRQLERSWRWKLKDWHLFFNDDGIRFALLASRRRNLRPFTLAGTILDTSFGLLTFGFEKTIEVLWKSGWTARRFIQGFLFLSTLSCSQIWRHRCVPGTL